MAYDAGAILEAKVLYRVNAQTCMNVFHYAPTALGTGVDPIPLVDDFLAQFASLAAGEVIPAMADLMSQNVTIFQATGQLIHPKRYIVRTLDLSVVGTIADGCSRQNTAISFTKTGILGKRSNVGTTHIGGVADALFAAGLIAPAAAGPAGTLANAIKATVLGSLGGVNYDPCILNKTLDKTVTPPKLKISGFSLINDVVVQQTARTMRRRTVGLGI